MDKRFVIIAITSPESIPNEADRIVDILRSGKADIVHVRKPGWDLCATADLIDRIDPAFYSRIKIHDHFELLDRFPLMGVHLNSRNETAPQKAISVSRSIHSIEQLHLSEHYNYVTLSPIFDSISKRGYRSAFSLPELTPLIKGKNVIALGGVTPDKIPLLENAGFAGAAMLGYFWNS